MTTELRDPQSRTATATIPPLENGDHLTRDEFERRYAAMPHVKKAELIEGIVYMPSHVTHGRELKGTGTTMTTELRDPQSRTATATIPPLENGDHLTRDEFERRYAAMPHVKKAELIEGVVYMSSPVTHEGHSGPHGRLCTWCGLYCFQTAGTDFGDNGTVRLELDMEPQPDVFLRILPDFGGQTRRVADADYVEGAPELVVEIAASTASYDLHVKLDAYRRNGVREYLVWRTRDRAIDWFINEGGEFVPLAASADGVHRSRTFPGLWLDVAALLAADLPRVHAVLQQGLAAPEHAAFVEKLAAARPTR